MKSSHTLLTTLLAILQLVACGNDSSVSESKTSEPVLTAATLGEQVVLPTAQYLAAPPYSLADPDNGEAQARICKACHSLDKGGPNMIGPVLYGMFGREAGALDGFTYSAAMQGISITWTPRALDAWLAQPATFLPGNSMTFAGVFNPQDRDDLIAYLLSATDNNKEGE